MVNLPQIEGFQPIPNAVMIPFMEAQSAALAYGFGLNYEYGKRKIRSMSNDEFNSLTSEQIANMSNEHTHIILSKFQAAVPRVMPMQQEIFKQYVTIEKAKVIQNIELAKWITDYVATGTNTAIEQFFTNLAGGTPAPTKDLLPSTLPPSRPTSIAQVKPTLSRLAIVKIKNNITKNLTQLRNRLITTEARLRHNLGQRRTKFKNGRNVTVYVNPTQITSDTQLVATLKREIAGQQEQLARVNRGQTPY